MRMRYSNFNGGKLRAANFTSGGEVSGAAHEVGPAPYDNAPAAARHNLSKFRRP